MAQGHIVAMGGGGFSSEPDNPGLDDFLLDLSGVSSPKVCFVGTATGDADSYALKFFETFSTRRRGVATRLHLFGRPDRAAEILSEQDVVYVGGGNTANMLAVWRLHGVDLLLREAWERGAVLGGVSAGAICWFHSGVTDSFGPQLAPLEGCLDFVAGSFCPHYDSEPRRRPTFQALVADGRLPAGYAADDGAALHFAGTDLVEAVCSRPSAAAYRVAERDGTATEERLPTRLLG
jgi:dipeptidase E